MVEDKKEKNNISENDISENDSKKNQIAGEIDKDINQIDGKYSRMKYEYPHVVGTEPCRLFFRFSNELPFYYIFENEYKGIKEKISIEQFVLNYFYFKETSRLRISFCQQLNELTWLPLSFVQFLYERFADKEMIETKSESEIKSYGAVSGNDYILASAKGNLYYYIKK